MQPICTPPNFDPNSSIPGKDGHAGAVWQELTIGAREAVANTAAELPKKLRLDNMLFITVKVMKLLIEKKITTKQTKILL